MSDLVIKELTLSLRDNFLLSSDCVAFAENPEWSARYCSACHFANDRGKLRVVDSPQDLSRRKGWSDSSPLHENGRSVGWLNVVVGLLSCSSHELNILLVRD